MSGKGRRRCRRYRAAQCVALALGALCLTASTLPSFAANDVQPSAEAQSASRSEYERVARQIELSAARQQQLTEEIAAVGKDNETITAALIEAAAEEKKLAADVDAVAARLDGLSRQQHTVRRSLNARRDVLAEVLGALQRMGLNPPPALLVTPEDALSSVRSAILLGAVVPGLRRETDILVASLAELSRITASIAAERDRMAAAVTEQKAERQRLDLLLAEKKKLGDTRVAELAGEQRQTEALASRAQSLKELIAGLERQAAVAQAARAKEEQRQAELASLPVPDANRLATASPFIDLKGQLALPVSGRISRRFGADDGNGGVMLGDMVATQSTSIVTAPADGTVLYAGPFRSYGQLLILNAGDGYHVVLAGMSAVSVGLGQPVLAGEPVGSMNAAQVASAGGDAQQDFRRELYVEFRKDGKPVDPAPWWAERLSGRTGNGT